VAITNNKITWQIASANLFYWAGVYLFLPVLPLWYNKLGMSGEELGIAIGMYSLGSLSFRILAGRIADYYGHQKVTVISMITTLLTILAYFFVNNYFSILFFRFLHGMSGAGYSSASSAAVTLVNHDDKVKDAISLYTLLSMIGISLSTSLAIYLYHIGNINLIISCSFATTLLSVAIFTRKNLPIQSRQNTSESLSVREIILNSKIYIPTINQFSIYLCYGCLMTFLPLIINSQGKEKYLTIYYLVYAISIVFSRVFITKISNLMSVNTLVTYILFLLSATMLLTIHIDLSSIILLGVGIGVCSGLGTPVLASLIVANSKSSNRGTALGFFSMAIDLGIFSGSVIMGLLVQNLGFHSMYLIVFILTVMNIAFYLNWIRNQEKILTMATQS